MENVVGSLDLANICMYKDDSYPDGFEVCRGETCVICDGINGDWIEKHNTLCDI